MRYSLKLRLSESRAKFACALPNVSKFKVSTALMWQSGVVAKGQNKSATSCGDCGHGEIHKFLFRLRVGRGPCNS